MANKLYPLAREAFARALVDWMGDNIRVAAVNASYVYSAAHQTVTDLGPNIVARSPNLASKSVTGGVLNSDPALFAALTGATVRYLVVFLWSGADATSLLLYYIDTANVLPTIPIGIDVTVQPDPPTGWMQI